MTESAARVLAFKKKSKELKRHVSPPTQAGLEKLSRQLWEFGEQVRLETLGEGIAMIVAGMMSGTSADGIDVALVKIWEAGSSPVRSELCNLSSSNSWPTPNIPILTMYDVRCWQP